MYVHVGKTSVMFIGTRQNLSMVDLIQINIDNEIIKEVENQKLLGITTDKTLCWDKETDIVSSNITWRITPLKLLSKYVDKQNLSQYFNSYILPMFYFGCMIWGRCSAVKLQKRSARIILRVDMMTSSQLMFNKLQWLPFQKRIQYHTCIMMFKSQTGMAPNYMTDLF